MGIAYRTMEFLTYCATTSNSSKEKVDFSHIITLGRQNFLLTEQIADDFFKKHLGDNYTGQQRTMFLQKLKNATAFRYPNNIYSEPVLELLGAKTVDSIDYSDYEEATVIQDLCVPIPNTLKNKYSCVFDGGLLEHIYNYNIAFKNTMDMVAVGGHLILVTPGNNYFGHGFYQFSPELFYSVLREQNGFSDTQVYICNEATKQWYLVKNPRHIHKRTELSPKWDSLLLYVVSKKINDVPENVMTYQSDYEEEWASKEYNLSDSKHEMPLQNLKGYMILKRLCPNKIKKMIKYRMNYKELFKELFTPVNFW